MNIEDIFQDTGRNDEPFKEFYGLYNGQPAIIIHSKNYADILDKRELKISDINLPYPIVIIGIKNVLTERPILQKIRLTRCKNVILKIVGQSDIQGISLIDCDVKKIEITNATIGTSGLKIYNESTFDHPPTVECIHIENAQIKGQIKVSNIPKLHLLNIIKTSFALSKEEHLKSGLNHNIILDKLQVDALNLLDTVHIENGILISNASINKLIVNDIDRSKECHIKQINLFNIDCIENIYINNITTQNINFIYCRYVAYTYFNNIKFQDISDQGSNFLNNLNVKKFAFTDKNFFRKNNSSLEITESEFAKFHLSNIDDGKSLRISQGAIHSGLSNNVHFNLLGFYNVLSKSSILFIDGLKCNKIEFDNFTNAGLLYLKNLHSVEHNIEKLITIHNSDLGVTHFINCSLVDEWAYDFKNSIITSVHIVASDLPLQQKIHNKRENNYWQKRLLFSQLHRVYEAAGSRVRAISTNKIALEAYLLSLPKKIKTEKGWRKKIRLIWDGIALLLHNISSNFDYSLSRAIGVLFLTTILLYYSYLCSLGFKPANFTAENKTTFYNLVAHYFVFLNPIHKANFIQKVNSTDVYIASPIAIFIDAISKIIIGYLIYQMIQAFRKFGKK